jgi:hypothetical protein
MGEARKRQLARQVREAEQAPQVEAATAQAIEVWSTLKPGEQVEVPYPDGSSVFVICDPDGGPRLRTSYTDSPRSTQAEREYSKVAVAVGDAFDKGQEVARLSSSAGHASD